MRSHFDQQLSALNRDLTRMGALCEEILKLVTQALRADSQQTLRKLPALAGEIDRMERSIESACLALLLQQQPVARDLRQISAALKMITDLERIGDQAEDIGQIIPYLAGAPGEELSKLQQMAQAAGSMVTQSVDAYIGQDVAQARAVVRQDDTVDAFFVGIKHSLIRQIQSDTASGEWAIDLIMIAKYLERIGDHAVNIAQWVEFSVTGVHKTGEDL